MGIEVGGLIGLLGGMITGLAGWYFGRKKANKERGLDEIHEHIWQKARSYSWYTTLIVIYLLFFLYIFGVSLSVPIVLAILMFIHLFSWAIFGTIFSSKIYSENEGDKQITKFVIGFFTIFGFAILLLIFLGKIF